MPNPSNRAKLACNACVRRKVRCSKTIPCTHCVRRGEQDTCGISGNEREPAIAHSLAGSTVDLAGDTPQPASSHPGNRHSSSSSDEEDDLDEPRLSRRHNPEPRIIERENRENEKISTQHAASILEFLAWGRRKDPEYGSVISPELCHRSPGDALDSVSDPENGDDHFDDFSQPSVIQLLLPSSRQVWQLVDYHEKCLLWYHSSYAASAFRTQLDLFYDQYNGIITKPGVNLQWVALLFSIMAASLVCAPREKALSWGFRDPERNTLSKRWFQAVTNCLNRAQYTSKLSIFSCQAIATSTVSAHLLGFSNSQSIQLAAAIRIAQSLSLHCLDYNDGDTNIEKEIGRRVWCQLCYQDWFSIPFSESYLINPVCSTSLPPANCDDLDMALRPSNVPTITSYCRFLYEIASVMPQLQDGLLTSNTSYTRYKQVLFWDARLRDLATTERPPVFGNSPVDPSWPCWVAWGRRALAITFSHKIIMIHRSFLSESFTNPAFDFTRRTCLAASKTIIKEYKCAIKENGPILWIHQAFSVAACIILILDLFHRDADGREVVDHKSLVEDVLQILRRYDDSMIAVRGVRLLDALLNELDRCSHSQAASQSRKRKRDEHTSSYLQGISKKVSSKLNVSAFIKAICTDNPGNGGRAASPIEVVPEEALPARYDHDNIRELNSIDFAEFDLNFSFPHLGFDGVGSFENLLHLANSDLLPRNHGPP